MLSEQERESLIDEMKQILQPGFKSVEDIKHIEKRGAEILRNIIDDDILNKCIELTKPIPEKYGFISRNTVEGGDDGWTIEGGEEAYEEALKIWEANNG